MSRIEIDLDLATSMPSKPGDRGFAFEGTIRRHVLQQVIGKLVAKPAGEAERDDPRRRRPLALDVMAYRAHEAILVSARRGDGKTTFLTDILRLIEAGRSVYLPYLPEITAEDKLASLYSLGIVDPTLIETKQNIVVLVIEKIKAAVDRAYRLEEGGKRASTRISSKRYANWQPA